MKRLIILIVSLSATLLHVGCGQQTSAIELEKQRWSNEGWSYLETIGTPGDDAVYLSHMSSSTAHTITAFASSGGLTTNRIFEQNRKLYLAVTMQRPSADTFALIFEKSKP